MMMEECEIGSSGNCSIFMFCFAADLYDSNKNFLEGSLPCSQYLATSKLINKTPTIKISFYLEVSPLKLPVSAQRSCRFVMEVQVVFMVIHDRQVHK
jgi:hypothetical protein